MNCCCSPLMLFLFAPFLPFGLAAAGGGKEEKLSNRPRGVSPQFGPLYQEREEFECLDGNKKIPYEQVNDDYCDCADGSDEPGTSACKNGRFYCANFGFRPVTVPSSRVNDFICDCCDGSDEWDSGTECPNVCEKLGEKAREEAKEQAEVREAGYAKRRDLAKEGSKMLDEKKLELEKKKKELEQIEQLKREAEERKKGAEELEGEAKGGEDARWEEGRRQRQKGHAEQMYAAMDADGDRKVTSDELKKQIGYEEDKSEDAEKDMLKELFTEDSGDLLNFDAFLDHFDKVKELIRKVKEAKQRRKEESTAAAGGESEDEPAEKEKEIDEEEDKSAADEEEEEDKPAYSEKTLELIAKADEARKEYDEVGNKVSELEAAIRDSEAFLDFEYGPDLAWAPLRGQCAELTTSQYVYRLCPFDRTVQKDRNGHSEISLGHWGKWAGPEDDANKKFNAQQYEHGQSCWNGPERSTFVSFACGEQLQLIEASEPSKCEYHFAAKSPTACADPEELRKAAEHAEL